MKGSERGAQPTGTKPIELTYRVRCHPFIFVRSDRLIDDRAREGRRPGRVIQAIAVALLSMLRFSRGRDHGILRRWGILELLCTHVREPHPIVFDGKVGGQIQSCHRMDLSRSMRILFRGTIGCFVKVKVGTGQQAATERIEPNPVVVGQTDQIIVDAAQIGAIVVEAGAGEQTAEVASDKGRERRRNVRDCRNESSSQMNRGDMKCPTCRSRSVRPSASWRPWSPRIRTMVLLSRSRVRSLARDCSNCRSKYRRAAR